MVQHQNELSFPFKRYQIQPVWRADRPQHGRYQEFFQCDADVVGSDSLIYEVDFIQLFDEVLTNLGVPAFTIYINNRKILSGIAEVSGESDRLIDITVALDKLDKIGEEGVIKELQEKGVAESSIERIQPLLTMTGSNSERLEAMKTYLASSEIGLKGIEELVYVIETAEKLGLEKANLVFDVTLARGLNYYTGAIFEVKADGVKMGSICGGGRYDNLTDLFGGAAAANAETYAGRLARMQVAFDEVKETIGFALLPILEKSMRFINTYAQPVIEALTEGLDNKSGLGYYFNLVALNLKNVFLPIWDGLVYAFNKIKDAIADNSEGFLKFGKLIAEYVAPVVGTVLGGALKILGDIAGGVLNIIGKVAGFITDVVETAIKGVNALIRAYNSIPAFVISISRNKISVADIIFRLC